MNLDKLSTKCIGKNLIYYESIDSTQKEAWRLVEKNIPNGSLIASDIQTDGIGTHGRKWYTEIKGNIAFSIILYPKCTIERLNDITQDIAKIIVKVFKNLYKLELDIKFPNDIMHKGKKLGGILTETKLCGKIVKNLVIGIGLNLNQEEFHEDIKDIASSIKNEFDIYVDRDKIITEVCNLLEMYFEKIFDL